MFDYVFQRVKITYTDVCPGKHIYTQKKAWVGILSTGVEVLIVLLLLAVTVSPAIGTETHNEKAVLPKIVNGLTSHDFPATAALLRSSSGVIDEDNASTWCSALCPTPS